MHPLPAAISFLIFFVPDVKEIMRNPGKVPYIDKQQKIKYDPAPQAPMPKANFVETNKILGR